MIGRTDSPTALPPRNPKRAKVFQLSSDRGRILILAAMLLVFAGIAMVDYVQNKSFTYQESRGYPLNNVNTIDLTARMPNLDLGSAANFYDNDFSTPYQASQQAQMLGALRAADGRIALINEGHMGSTEVAQTNPIDRDDSVAKHDTDSKPAASLTQNLSTAAAPVIAGAVVRESNSIRTPSEHRRISKKNRQYRRNASTFSYRNLASRRASQRASSIESRTVTTYATVYQRKKKRGPLGMAAKLITAPVKFLVSPFKRKENYD